jgi:hypothetical protein
LGIPISRGGSVRRLGRVPIAYSRYGGASLAEETSRAGQIRPCSAAKRAASARVDEPILW